MTTKRSITLDGEIYWAALDVVAEIYKCTEQSAVQRIWFLQSQETKGPIVSKLLSRKHVCDGSTNGRKLSFINAAEIEELHKYLSKKYPKFIKTMRPPITLDGEVYRAAIDVAAEIVGSTLHCAMIRLRKMCHDERVGPYVSQLLSRKYTFQGSGNSPISIINTVEMEELRKFLPGGHMYVLTNTTRPSIKTNRSVTLDGEIYWAAVDVVGEIYECYHSAASAKLIRLTRHEKTGPRVSKLLSRKHRFSGPGNRPISIINADEIEELRKYIFDIKNNQPKKGFVYAAYSEGNGTKIGMTMRGDPAKRLKEYNICIKHSYVLIDFIQCQNPTILEGYIHFDLNEYKNCDHNKELFDLPHQDLITTFFHYIKEELKKGKKVSQFMVSDAFYKCMQQPRFNS